MQKSGSHQQSHAVPISISKRFEEISLGEEEEEGKVASSSLVGRSKDVQLFILASELESLGKVSKAIKLYEQAFRLNPQVDKIISNEGLENLVNSQESNDGSVKSNLIIRPKFTACVPGLYDSIQESLCGKYEQPLELADEVMIRILYWVGLFHAVSLEECAKTCRKLYLFSREESIWRAMYKFSRVGGSSSSSSSSSINPGGIPRLPPPSPSHCFSYYRQLYFECPRIRTDGIYICKITYFRPGLTEGTFFQPVHMVTYYRYLRAFSFEYGYNAMLLVTTEEPKKVIELLRKIPEDSSVGCIPFGVRAIDLISNYDKQRKSTHHRTGTNKLAAFKKTNLFMGKYFRKEGGDDPIFYLTLFDPQQCNSSTSSLFEMSLRVSPKRGNSIFTCESYCSISPPSTTTNEDGGAPPNVYQFDISQWGKFIFSRVKSYIT